MSIINHDCPNPHDIRAIPLRVIGDNGKPKPVTWGNLCMSCGNTEQTNFSDIFKPKRGFRSAINIKHKFSSEEISEFERLTDIGIRNTKTDRKDRKTGRIIFIENSPEISLKSKLRGLGFL